MVSVYAIGRFQFQVSAGLLRDPSGRDVILRAKTAAVLSHLASKSGQVVSSEELLDAVWPGLHVSENNLSQSIAEIRRALGSDYGALQTLPRRGFMLSASPLKHTVSSSPSRRAVPVLAVFPFSVSTPDIRSFADILLDCLVGALCTLREPIVISASSTRRIASDADATTGGGARLGADYIITGRLQYVGRRIHLALELAELKSEAVIWYHAEELDEVSLTRIPADLCMKIARIFVPQIRATELRQVRRQPHDASAYQLVLDAQCLMGRLDRQSFARAKELLDEASSIDASFAMPHVVLGNWYSLMIGQRWSEDFENDRRSLEREIRIALELDPFNSRALALFGHNHTILLRDYDAAEELLDRAIEIAPNDAETYLWSSPTLTYAGRPAEALERAKWATKLSPLDPLLFRFQHFLSIAHYGAGNFEAAAEEGLRSYRNNPEYSSNWLFTVAALGALGRREEAKPVVQRCLRQFPHYRAKRNTTPFRDKSKWEEYVSHLISGGIPP